MSRSRACAGDKYEGEWKNGRENGVGTSMAADGSTFYGFWLDGLMHGEGVSHRSSVSHQASPADSSLSLWALRRCQSWLCSSPLALTAMNHP